MARPLAPSSAPTHVLFDFFGTLVDYSPSRTAQGYNATHALLREAGCGLGYDAFLALWEEVCAGLDAVAERTHREYSMRDAAAAFLRHALGAAPDDLDQRFARSYVAEWNGGVRYRAETAAMLERLARRFTLAVVSNAHDADVVPDHLARMGVAHHFQLVVISVVHGMRKPHPSLFAHAVEALGAAPERCVYVGDTYEADFVGARGAGLRAYLIDPAGRASIPPEARLASLSALEQRLARGRP